VTATARARAPAPAPDRTPARSGSSFRLWVFLAAAAGVWLVLYLANASLWDMVVFRLAGLDPDSRLGSAVHFFFYDTAKVLLLLAGLMFAIGMARASVGPERVRAALQRKHAISGYLLAAGLGAVTPFCSCSSIPLFIGLAAAGVPLGIAFTFLLASPLINEVGVVMLLSMFGWQIPALYVAMGLLIAIAAGLALSRLPLDRWIEPFVFASPVAQLGQTNERPTLHERIGAARAEVIDILRKVWLFVVVGVALGAAIHGWIPEGFFTSWAGPGNPWALPVAAVAGLPLYANVASVIPLVQALSAKGVALGTLMAFMTSVVALSLPSLVMLRRVIKLPLLAMFTAVVASGAMLVGFVFNLLL
jgi:uncharacterized protein